MPAFYSAPKRRAYISGPMTGLPDANYPAFNAAAARLRELGFHVENPAENQTPPCGGTWLGWMRLALAQMLQCEMIVRLPGWKASKGARIEVWLARVLGLEVYDIHEIEEQA